MPHTSRSIGRALAVASPSPWSRSACSAGEPARSPDGYRDGHHDDAGSTTRDTTTQGTTTASGAGRSTAKATTTARPPSARLGPTCRHCSAASTSRGRRGAARRQRPGQRAQHRPHPARAQARLRGQGHRRRTTSHHAHGRRGRPPRARRPGGLRRRPRPLRVLLDRQRQPHRGRAVARRHDRRAGRHLLGHPPWPEPQRRPHRLRPRRLPLRRHGRGRRHLPVAEPRVARRQDPAHHPRRRAGAGQPVRRLPHLVLRPPQRPGPCLGQPETPVGQRVRCRTRWTSSTSSSPARTTAGPRSRAAPATRTSSTRLPSGRRRRCRRAASPSAPTAPSTWPRCAASRCGACPSTPTARPARRPATCKGTYGRIRDIRFVDNRVWITTSNNDRADRLHLAAPVRRRGQRRLTRRPARVRRAWRAADAPDVTSLTGRDGAGAAHEQEGHPMGSYDEILDQVPIDQLAGQLGVGRDEVRQAAEHALPALLGGLQANASDPAGADSLLAALSDHQGAGHRPGRRRRAGRQSHRRQHLRRQHRPGGEPARRPRAGRPGASCRSCCRSSRRSSCRGSRTRWVRAASAACSAAARADR